METNEPKASRNRDQDIPPRKGESIEAIVPAEGERGEGDRNAPLPEEETYEREPPERSSES